MFYYSSDISSQGLGTDEMALIEILMTRTNAQIKEIRDVYSSGMLTSVFYKMYSLIGHRKHCSHLLDPYILQMYGYLPFN